jgi:hypothetical protein
MEVRHVRVKSSIDILGELEKLRRQVPLEAQVPETDKPAARKKSSFKDVDDLLISSMDQRKEISKSFDLGVRRDSLGKAGEVVITLTIVDAAKKGLEEPKVLTIPLRDVKFIRQLLLNLKIDFHVQ